MNIKKLLLTPIIALSLAGCNNAPAIEETSLETLYKELKAYNYTATNEEGSFYFFGEDALLTNYKQTPNISGGLFKNTQGVFEYVLVNNTFEVQGMSSPVKELNLYNFFTSPADLISLPLEYWTPSTKTENVYNFDLKKGSGTLDILEQGFGTKLSGYSIRNLVLTVYPSEAKADFMLRYEDSKSESHNIFVHITDIGSTKNEKVANFVKSHQTINKQTDWTNYQKAVFDAYEITVPPYFYTGYSIGLSLSFTYYNAYGFLTAYDLMSSKEHVKLMGNELVQHGYKLVKEGEVSSSFERNDMETGVNSKIEVGFVSVDDLVSEPEKISCPNGYLQVVYSYGPAYTDADFTSLNTILNRFEVNNATNPSNYVNKVTITDYTKSYNDSLLAVLEEAGITPTTTELIVGMYHAKLYTELFEDAESVTISLFNELLKADSAFMNSKAADAKIYGKTYTGDTSITPERLPTMGNALYVCGTKFINDDKLVVNIEIFDYNYEKEGCVEMMIEVYNIEAFEYI